MPLKNTYNTLGVSVERLLIREEDLNTKRMLDIMTASNTDGPKPLYFQTVSRILREMRIVQQNTGTRFSYSDFKMNINGADLTPAQLGPLKQRLDTLESFMPNNRRLGRKKADGEMGNDWTHMASMG
jgi:hypothetical protein